MSPKSNLRIIFTIFAILTSITLFSQVTGVNYQIRFNPSNCLFEARLIINSGSAVSALQRAQFSAQYSIVVPSTSTLNLVANHMPLQNNQTYGGTQPTIWFVSSFIHNPAALPGYDFYSVTPSLTPTSFYNNLNAGDTIRLFSFTVDPLPSCGYGVRPYENGVDPGSAAPGMGGGDFTNGFTIGGPAQKYEDNSPTIYGKSPIISQFQSLCTPGISIALNATTSGCQSPLSFNWSGPMDFAANTQNISIPNANHLNNGNYQVVISDNIGCRDTLEINAYAKPDAGTDQNVNCFLSGQATIASAGPGIWSLGNNSAGTANISNTTDPVITVSAFSTPGNYYLIKTLNNCSDTTVITTANNCGCGITNIIQQPVNNTFCDQSGNVQLNGNNPDISGSYLWQYKINDQTFINATGTNNFQNYTTQSLNPGTYTFRRIFSKSDSPECIDTSNQIVIIVGIQPNAGSDHQLNCHENTVVNMNASGNGFWYLGSGSSGTLQITSVTNPNTSVNNFSNPGTYYLVWANMYCRDTSVITILNLCGCDQADAGPDQNACSGNKRTIQGNCSIGLWSANTTNPAGASLTNTDNGLATVTFNTNAQGTFKFIFTINDTWRDTMQILVTSLPVIDAGQNFNYCESSPPVTIVAGGAQSYVWSTGHTGSSINVSPAGTSTYSVTGTNSMGCSASDTITVFVIPKPQGSIPPIPPCYEYDNLQLLSGQWTNGFFYAWTGPSNFTSNQQNPVIPEVGMHNSGMYYLTVTSIDECSNTAQIDVKILQRPLPVELLQFEGRYLSVKSSNQLNWVTSAEINNAYFILERSFDGQNFIEILKKESAGKSTLETSYTTYDTDLNHGKIHFYRLKQVDLDGKHNFSKTISIHVPTRINQGVFKLELYPNPALNYTELYVKGDELTNASLRMIDATGKLILVRYFDEVFENKNLLEKVDFSDLSAGVYSIQVFSDQLNMHKSLIIQK